MPDQGENTGNEGDVVKHASLQKVVSILSGNNSPTFWYVETHSAYPYYNDLNLSVKAQWRNGIGDLNVKQSAAPPLLQGYLDAAYHDKQKLHDRFPDKQTYLGSTAQIFHLLKKAGKRVLMTLFEIESEPVEALLTYFEKQKAAVVLVRPGDDRIGKSLRAIWDAAIPSTNDDFVMVVQGDCFKLAPLLWEKGTDKQIPDLVFVDPFNLEKVPGLIESLSNNKLPFACWTPLNCVKEGDGQKWPATKWSIETIESRREWIGNKTAQNFVAKCRDKGCTLAWFCWDEFQGFSRNMHGCQLTFGNVFSPEFTPAAVWPFNDHTMQLPYLDIDGKIANLDHNFQNLTTTWQEFGQELDRSANQVGIENKPGAQWWDKYNAAFWWR